MVIRQLSKAGSDPIGHGNLWIYDFCISKKGSESSARFYLNNNKGNGWQWDYNKAYTKFILRLIK